MMAKPNVLLIFVDQMRFDAIGAMGNAVIKTPNLDRLCAMGTVFSSAYSPSPVCVPARCSLHYGQYPSTSGCYENNFPMPTGQPSFMEVLSDEGYTTCGIGKCHFTPDLYAMRGFQKRLVMEEIVDNPMDDDYLKFLFDKGFGHITDPHGARGEMYYVPQLAQMPAKYHPTQWIGDRSVEFIDGQKDCGKPWFLFSSFVHPHPPFVPPAPWHKLYRAPLMPLPKVPQDWQSLLIHINRVQNRYKFRDQGIDNNLLRCIKAYYYACVSFIDHQIGRIFDTLEASGQLDNTLIIFTADHGEHLGDRNCFGKRSMHDSAARIPMIAAMKGRFEPGKVCSRPVSLVDVAPTILAAASLEGKMMIDGINLADIAAGRREREFVFSEYAYGENSVCMAVSDRWKYFYSVPDGRGLFFDRKCDPDETRNLADCPAELEAGQVCEQIKAKLIAHLEANGRNDIIEGGKFKPFMIKTMPVNPDKGLLLQDMPWANQKIKGYNDDK